jgi:ODP family beta lactamase
MDRPYRAGDDVYVLPSGLDVPGVGTIPINSFVLLSEQPVLVDSGLAIDGPEYVEALRTVIDPSDLQWIWLTHDDSDHTGNLQTIMDLAPNARLATHGLGALRMSAVWPVPLDRVHAVRPGDRLDVGDRTLRALRPPTYDNPMSTAIFDDSTSTLFAVDSFGAILPHGSEDIDAFAEDELVGGMVAWTTFDSPWTHLTDRALFAGTLDDVRKLEPARLLPSHLPPVIGRVDQLLKVVASVPDAEPFAAPDAAAFDQIVAAMRVGRP